MRILTDTKPVLLQVIYYLPDYPSLVQEFILEFDDKIPQLIRTHKFLNYWKSNIDAIIADIFISINRSPKRDWRSIDELLNLK